VFTLNIVNYLVQMVPPKGLAPRTGGSGRPRSGPRHGPEPDPVPDPEPNQFGADSSLLVFGSGAEWIGVNFFWLRYFCIRDEHGPDPDRSRILTFFGRIGAGLGFIAGPDRSRIVMSRVCQLKYAMSYVRTTLKGY